MARWPHGNRRVSGGLMPPGVVQLVTAVTVVVALAGCTLTFQVSPQVRLPQHPLIERFPLTIGVYYDPAFRAYEGTTEDKTLKISLGPGSIAVLDQALASAFERVVQVGARAASPGEPVGVDAIIEPTIDAVYLNPLSSVPPSGVRITYGMTLYSPQGERLTFWQVTGVGAHPWSVGWGPSVAARATENALRDAAAQVLVSLDREPGVQRSLKTLGARRRSTEEPEK